MFLIILFGIFIVPPLLLSIIYRKYANPWRLYMIFGKKGSGKSSYLIKMAYKYLKKGYTVYTNMEDCTIPGVRIFNIQHLGEFVPDANSLLLCDEVGLVWDARDFKNFRKDVRDFFKLQRHYKVICYLASQSFDIDKKLRDLTDGMMLCTNLLTAWSLCRTISRRIVLTQPQGDTESRISEQLVFEPFWRWHLTYIPRYAKGYDSYQTPEKPALPYKENPPLQNKKEKRVERKEKKKKNIAAENCAE